MYLIYKHSVSALSSILSVLVFVLSVFTQLVYAAPVGQIGLIEGSVTVTKITGKRVFVAEGSNLDIGDVVVTGSASKAMLAFTDGGKIALRPNTVFQITEYAYAIEAPKQDSAVFQLLKGGLRTVTGLVGKRGNQNAYQLGNNTSTIGIRGTEYIARVCDANGCDEDSQKKGKPIIRQQPIARVVMLKGSVFREGILTNYDRKPVLVQDALYLGDMLITTEKSQLGILFTDGTRVVLPANTVFKVDAYQFSRQDNLKERTKDGMVLHLLKGAARVVTGLVGKHNPSSVKYVTATSTIGIRGTNFDISCIPTGSSASGELASGKLVASTDCDKALASTVREGAVDVSSEGGTQAVNTNQSAYVDSSSSKPILLSSAPKLFEDDVALPEALDSNTEKAFGIDEGQVGKEGMFVTVIEGKVSVQQQGLNLNLEQGESGFASSSGGSPEGVFLLNSTPNSTNYDPFLKSVKFDSFSCGL